MLGERLPGGPDRVRHRPHQPPRHRGRRHERLDCHRDVRWRIANGPWSCAVGGCGGNPTLLANAGIPFGVAVDSNAVYWTDNDDGSIHKVAKTAGAKDVVLYDGGSYDDAGDTLSLLGQLVVDGNNLYMSDYSEDIIAMSINGGAPLYLGDTVNNGSYGSYFGIVTDSTSVYVGGGRMQHHRAGCQDRR